MSDIVIDAPVSAAAVEAELNYLEFTGEKPVSYQYEPPPGVPKRSGVYRPHRVTISNARIAPPPGALSLDRNGFELHRHASALSDFSDPAKIESIYYRQAEQLLKQATGARRVVVFDHTLRDGDPERTKGVREPVKYIHNDQTFVSGPRRVRDHLPTGEAEQLLQDRVAIVNLWRPIGETVQSSPLALCVKRLSPTHRLVAADRREADGVYANPRCSSAEARNHGPPRSQSPERRSLVSMESNRFRFAWLVPVKQDVGDDTGRDGGEYIVPVHADPLIPARWRLQAVFVPVVDNVIAIPVLCRKPLALVPIVMGNGTARAPQRRLVRGRGTTMPVLLGLVPWIGSVLRRLAAAVIVLVLLRKNGDGCAE
jgi:hypothetical protein